MVHHMYSRPHRSFRLHFYVRVRMRDMTATPCHRYVSRHRRPHMLGMYSLTLVVSGPYKIITWLSMNFDLCGTYYLLRWQRLQNRFTWESMRVKSGLIVSLFTEYIRSFPFSRTETKWHIRRRFRLWEVTVCSKRVPRAISETLFEPFFARKWIILRRFPFASVRKNLLYEAFIIWWFYHTIKRNACARS